MGFGDLAHQRQAESITLHMLLTRGAVERLEHLFPVRFGNAIATVADRQQRLACQSSSTESRSTMWDVSTWGIPAYWPFVSGNVVKRFRPLRPKIICARWTLEREPNGKSRVRRIGHAGRLGRNSQADTLG